MVLLPAPTQPSFLTALVYGLARPFLLPLLGGKKDEAVPTTEIPSEMSGLDGMPLQAMPSTQHSKHGSNEFNDLEQEQPWTRVTRKSKRVNTNAVKSRNQSSKTSRSAFHSRHQSGTKMSPTNSNQVFDSLKKKSKKPPVAVRIR
jgi:hypothetical protein